MNCVIEVPQWAISWLLTEKAKMFDSLQQFLFLKCLGGKMSYSCVLTLLENQLTRSIKTPASEITTDCFDNLLAFQILFRELIVKFYVLWPIGLLIFVRIICTEIYNLFYLYISVIICHQKLKKSDQSIQKGCMHFF